MLLPCSSFTLSGKGRSQPEENKQVGKPVSANYWNLSLLLIYYFCRLFLFKESLIFISFWMNIRDWAQCIIQNKCVEKHHLFLQSPQISSHGDSGTVALDGNEAETEQWNMNWIFLLEYSHPLQTNLTQHSPVVFPLPWCAALSQERQLQPAALPARTAL